MPFYVPNRDPQREFYAFDDSSFRGDLKYCGLFARMNGTMVIMKFEMQLKGRSESTTLSSLAVEAASLRERLRLGVIGCLV